MNEAVKNGVAVEPAAAAPSARIKQIVIKLEEPVQAHGEMVKELTFRRPTGADIMSINGYPINIDWNGGGVSVNPPIMSEMMSLLAAVPPSTIKALDAQDWSTCAHALMGFFPPDVSQMPRY